MRREKNRNLRRPAAIFLFAAAEGGKGFREVFVKIYTGPVGEHRDYGLYLRGCSDIINIGAVCIKDICKKLDKRLERGAGPPQRGRAA